MVVPGAKKTLGLRADAAAIEAYRIRYEALSLVEERFCNFDLVWAKVHGFPWWPGVLFHSWDAVLHAGIHTDPKIVAELVVPAPEKVAKVDVVTGQATGRFRVKRHCLIMFLDKFNFSVLEIDTTNVASFTSHYHLYERAIMGSKSSKWAKMKAEFKRALVKATQLLHMGHEYDKEDLVMLEAPSVVEKKQCMRNVREVETDEERPMDEAWDELEHSHGAAFRVDKGEAGTSKLQKKPMARKEKVTEVKSIENDNEVGRLTPAKQRRHEKSKDSKPRKRLRKEVHNAPHVASVSRSPSPIDLTDTPERTPHAAYNDKASGIESEKLLKLRNKIESSEADGTELLSSKKSSARVLVMEDGDSVLNPLAEQNDEQVFDTVAGITEEKMVLTPLSSIWTTGVSADPCASTGEHMQLAYKQDFVWDGAVFTDELSIAEKKKKAAIERKQAKDTTIGRERSSGKRQMRSFQQSQIRQNMMTGNLDPHTMVQCAVYRPKDYVDDFSNRSRGGPTLDPPFQVVVHPDAVFVADLHAHLATCEVIGFLGGKWDEASKTLFIQAAFPCRSLVIDGDDGSTDVEMDPGSEIELRGIIENAQLEVVGWYHSHPAFAPDPSVRDIENQTSYQQLFQRPNTKKEGSADNKPSEPFVGLIVGTYDTRRNTPVSLLRYFHTRGEKVSGGACREIYMPYEFIPGRRHFRKVLQDEERETIRLFPMYQSVLQHFHFELAATHYQLPVDIKATVAQRAMSRLSPTKVKRCGSTRKRKQSSDGTGDKLMKKARTRRKRFVRSSFVANSRIDPTGAGENPNLQITENGTATDTLETGHYGSTDAVTKRETSISNSVGGEKKMATILGSSDGVEESTGSTDAVTKRETSISNSVCEVKRMATIVGSSHGAEECTGISPMSVQELKSEVRSIESQVAEVLVDVVETTQATNSENGHDLSRKLQNPVRINETLASVGGAEYSQLLTENGVSPPPYTSTVYQNVMQHASSDLNEAKERKALFGVNAKAESNDACIPGMSSSSFSSAVKSGVLPSTSVSVSSRKRTRKPNKTTKNNNRSTSPDRLSPGMALCQTKSSGQAFYDAFRPSGPRFANGGIHEKVTPLFSRPDGPKGDNVLVEDVRYIVVDETMGMTLPSHDLGLLTKERYDTSIHIAKTTEDDSIEKEIQRLMTSLVEKVVSGSSDSSTVKTSVNDVIMDCTSMKRECPVSAGLKKTTTHAGFKVFGSNGECEDIQTSLQKMARHLDKLKSFQATMPSVTKTKLQKDLTPDIEPEHVMVRAESKQGDVKVEQDPLAALRTKYGAGVSGCAEQVITLVDYYRDFERRTDLNEIWKARTTKLEKIESSLSEYVQYLNIPVALRRDFIKDLILYLRNSWAIKDRRR